MKNMTDRETLPGYLRDLDIRLSRQERHVHARGASAVATTASVSDLEARIAALEERIATLESRVP